MEIEFIGAIEETDLHKIPAEFIGMIKSSALTRCKDCKHCIVEKLLCTHTQNRVFNTGVNVFLEHYCSYGERRCEE